VSWPLKASSRALGGDKVILDLTVQAGVAPHFVVFESAFMMASTMSGFAVLQLGFHLDPSLPRWSGDVAKCPSNALLGGWTLSAQRRLIVRVCAVAAWATALMLAPDARADLIQKTVQTDAPLTHLAWVIDTQLSPGANGHASVNWEWGAVQRVATDGRTWVIEVRARHVMGPHAGEAARGGDLPAIIPFIVPGHSGGGSVVRTVHPGRNHFDTLTTGYLAMSSSSSRLTISLGHPAEAVTPGTGWRDWPRKWRVVVGVSVVVVLAGAVWSFRRMTRRS